jgi:hypothetical protein
MEIWKEIKNYEGLYKISSYGNVKSLITNKLLKKCNDGAGYLIVQLYRNKKSKCCRVHQLVFENFNSIKSTTLFVIDHIDNNKQNNKLDNLQIITNRYNSSKDKKNKSGEYCIYLNGKSYLVRLRVNGIKKSLGTFKNIDDAIKCRDSFFKKEENNLNNYLKNG